MDYNRKPPSHSVGFRCHNQAVNLKISQQQLEQCTQYSLDRREEH